MTTAPLDPFNDPILDTLPQFNVPAGTKPAVDLEEDPADVPLAQPKLISVYTDDETGDVVEVYDDKTERIRKKGTKKAECYCNAAALSAERLATRHLPMIFCGESLRQTI
jgi:hypothetical protein